MISKELLSEVLGITVKFLDQKPTCVEYEDCGIYRFINIYELAHRCKEWLEKACSNYDIMIVNSDIFLMENIWGEGGAYTYKTFDKEIEWYLNIFKACQWVLDNKDKQWME